MSHLIRFILAFTILCTGQGEAQADLGPKPTISIELPSEPPNNVEGGTLLLCKKADCSDAMPLKKYGPQDFACIFSKSDKNKNQASYLNTIQVDNCGGMAYGFTPYLQLRLNRSLLYGGDVISNVFTKKAFNAHFKAYFTKNSLTVVEQ